MWSKFKKIDWKKISLYIFLSTLLISLVVLFCNALFKDAIIFYLPKIFIYIINIILFFVVFYLHQEQWEKRIKSFKHFNLLEKITKYIFLGSLLIIAFIGFENFLTQWQDKIIISNILSFIAIIENWQITLIIISIISGFFTFFVNREDVEKEIEKERIDEEKAEKKRYNEFENKFPRTNRIWGLRNIVKWIHKEGWWFSIPFVIITIIFILIKIGMPLIYSGSYIDEYNHILSGIEFFKTGHFAEIYKGEYYRSGSYVSFLIGLCFAFFGKTIFVAKTVPATIGIINFFLLFLISKKILYKKTLLLFLMATYTIIPWFIFNHFYIRMYVFYEFFILFLTLILILIIQNITNIKKTIIYSVTILSTLLIIYFLSYDSIKYMVILYSFIFLLYIFFFQIQKIPIKNKSYKYFNKHYSFKIGLFLLVIVIAFIYLNGFSLAKYLVSGNAISTSGASFKYNNLFFNLNVIPTIFFICSFGLLFIKKVKNIIKILIFSTLVIFLIHYNSSQDLQMTRVIIYFLPLFYLVSMTSISRLLLFFNNKFISVIILILLTLNCFINYPKNFLIKGPYIPTEVAYKNYKIASLNTNKILNNQSILITNFPQIYRFYNNKTKNKIYLIRDNEKSFYDTRLKYQDIKGNFFYTSTNDVIITNKKMFSDITANNEVVLLIDRGFYNSWITEESRNIIENKFKIKKIFGEIAIYEKK